ncbi:hypothetical protein ACOME3_000029 [Neoechinorhynchus agilis]
MNQVVEEGMLKMFEDVFFKETQSESASSDAVFNYAFCLVLQPSKEKSKITKGIKLLKDLINNATDDRSKSYYFYYLAIATFRLGDRDAAIDLCSTSVQLDPNNCAAAEMLNELSQEWIAIVKIVVSSVLIATMIQIGRCSPISLVIMGGLVMAHRIYKKVKCI